MVAGAASGFGLSERTTEFLTDTAAVGRFTIFVRRKTRLADWITRREILAAFGALYFERDKRFAIVDGLHGVVNTFHIITLVRKEGTLPDGNRPVGGFKNVQVNCGVCNIDGRSKFIQRESGNAIP